jgi:hypothetical protein
MNDISIFSDFPLHHYTGNYHDGRTEVLTEEGEWKLIKNISVDDKLASVNINTRELFYETPLNIFSKKYTGTMYVGKGRFLGFKVTPDHKLFVKPVYTLSDDGSSQYSYTIMNELPPFFEMLKYKHEGSYYGKINVRLSKDISIEKYNGWIYSVEMSTHHNLLTRRNGKILLSES